MSQSQLPYVVDPDDPRAPPQDVWDRLTREQREAVVAQLPSEFPVEAGPPPEGDPHFNAKVGARGALGAYFERIGRKVYLACELPVYYPGEAMFAPDIMAVVDVELHERMGWVVSKEGRGLDLAIEIHVAGDRRKDLIDNVARFARLGIREYFIFDRGRLHLAGYRLPSGSVSAKAPDANAYQRLVPQHGRLASDVLGLDLVVEDERLRFYHGTAQLAEASELIASLQRMVDGLQTRLDEEARLREEEARLREEEARLREEAEQRVAQLEAELAELKKQG